MKIPYTQYTKDNLEHAMAHYKATGEILDVLLVCFDQHGNWSDLPDSFDLEEPANLSDQVIPENRLVAISSTEEKILLCSFIDSSADPVNLDCHHVAGCIALAKTRQFSAPNLQTVGADLVAPSATMFNIPNLREVGQFLNACSATRFDAPSLQTVGDFLLAQSATIIDITKLHTVGGFLDVRLAKSFDAPSLKHVDNSLHAAAACTFSAPNLQIVDGFLIVESAIIFDAQNLETVNGALIAGSATTFNASKLVRVDGELILPVVTKVAVMPNCPVVRYKVADQI
jgi:hypothetical protein